LGWNKGGGGFGRQFDSDGIEGIWAADTNHIYFADGIVLKYENGVFNWEDFNIHIIKLILYNFVHSFCIAILYNYPKKFIGNEFFAEGRYIKCFYKTFYIAGLTPGNL